MKLSFRWYGKDDPISLEYISQIPGMRSIVSAYINGLFEAMENERK